MSSTTDSEKKLAVLVQSLVKEHSIAVEKLTEEQLVNAIKQAIIAGDFVRFVHKYAGGQEVMYIPFYEKEQLKNEVKVLRDFIRDTEKFIADGFYSDYKEYREMKLGINFDD